MNLKFAVCLFIVDGVNGENVKLFYSVLKSFLLFTETVSEAALFEAVKCCAQHKHDLFAELPNLL